MRPPAVFRTPEEPCILCGDLTKHTRTDVFICDSCFELDAITDVNGPLNNPQEVITVDK